MYIGLIVGFVNNSLLFPRIIGEEVLGFTQWLIELSGLFLLIASFGSNIAIVRFFPYFKNSSKQHEGYLGFLFVVRSVGVLATAAVILLLKDVVLQFYQNAQSQLYIEQYYLLLVVALALMCYLELLESYLAALMRPRVPTFFRDVFSRLTALILILMYALKWITLDAFIVLYACRFALSVLGLLAYTYYIKELHTRIGWQIFKLPIFKKLVNFSFYSIFATIGSRVTTKIDILMIPALMDFSYGGIYIVYSFFASVILVPHQGIAKIVSPILADAWSRQDFASIKSLYRRTALNNLAVGMLVFIGIVINLDNIVSILGPQFESGKYVAVLLGIGQLAHAANGYNGLLINYSPHYRYDLIFKVLTALLTVVTNYVLINALGIVGAALATAFTIILVNVLIQLFLYRRYRMHPFSKNMLSVVAAGAVCLLFNQLMPIGDYHFLLDLLLRSTLVTGIFIALVVGFRIAPDLADYFWNFIRKIRKR